MPIGKYVRTTKARKNIGLAAEGRRPWNKGATGFKQSAEHKARKAETRAATISDPKKRAEFLEKCRANGVRSRIKQAGRAGSCPEHFIRGYLSALGVDCVWQADVAGHVVDFLVPHMRLVLEYDGSWWHAHRGERDAAKDAALEAAGYRVARLTEKTLDVGLRETFGVARKEAAL